MIILMAVSGISYGFVAAFMPQSYSDSLNRTLAAKAKDLAESLSGYSLKNAAYRGIQRCQPVAGCPFK